MGHKAHVIGVAILLSSCGQAGPEAEARRIVASEMKDPASAQFRNVATVSVPEGGETKLYACGEVNGLNSFGARAGYQRFVVDVERKAVWFEPAPDANDYERLAFDARYGLAC